MIVNSGELSPRQPRREGPRREGPRREGPRREGPRREGPPREGPPREGPPREGPPRQVPPSERPGGEPDWAILVVGADRCLVDRLEATMRAAGHDEMRPPYGFVIRALAGGGLRLTELAERLGVTKQAALKVVDEMEARGLVQRVPAPGD